MKKFFAQYIDNKEGATAIEYSLIAIGVALAIITAVTFLGGELNSIFERAATLF